MKNRILIVDDERLARLELRSMLGEFADAEVVADTGSISGALMALRKHEIDVIFLDIQLHGETGFDLFDRTRVVPHVVFVTAYDSHAIRAFEVNALDYLLKPVPPERLARAMTRIQAGIPAQKDTANKLAYSDRIYLDLGGKPTFVPLQQIELIRAAGDYTQVVTCDGRTGLVLKTLQEWNTRLPANHFVRIHRSTIVNLNFIQDIQRRKNRTCHIYMKNQTQPLVNSRRFAKRLKERFS